MPKIKTHKGTAKRFKVTGTGKVLQMKGLRSHLRMKKTPRSKRLFSKMVATDPTNVRRVKTLIPYV